MPEPVAEVGGYFLEWRGQRSRDRSARSVRSGADIFGGADGMMDYGALAGLKFEVEAHGLKGQQQIGKDDGGIDAEFLGGGDGDFSGQFRLLADLDQGVVLADVAILLHVAAGLAQKPDGRAVDGAAQAGADEAAAVEDSVGSRESLVHFLHTGFDFTGRGPRNKYRQITVEAISVRLVIRCVGSACPDEIPSARSCCGPGLGTVGSPRRFN